MTTILTYNQAIDKSIFFGLSIQSESITNMWLTIKIQIQFSKWIENQIKSNHNFLEKDIGQQAMMKPLNSHKKSLILSYLSWESNKLNLTIVLGLIQFTEMN